MNHQNALLMRAFVGVGLIFAGWNYGVRPAHAKLDGLKQNRSSQTSLISQAGTDFEVKQANTNEVNQMVHLAGQRVFDVFAHGEKDQTARDLIKDRARAFSVAVNRIEPLRMTEFTDAPARSRYKKKTTQEKKAVRFMGEGIRVEFDGAFADIAGFLADLEYNVETVKLENFRMISSSENRVRMIAQFVNFDLIESPIQRSSVTDASNAATEAEG